MNPRFNEEEEDEFFDSLETHQHMDESEDDAEDPDYEENEYGHINVDSDHNDDDDDDDDMEDDGDEDEEGYLHHGDPDEYGGGDLEVELIMQPNDGNVGGGATRTARLSARQILALFNGGDLQDILLGTEGIEDDGDWGFGRRRRHTPPDPNRFPGVPSERGTELMTSGVFGVINNKGSQKRRQIKQSRGSRYYQGTPKNTLPRRLLERELALGDYAVRHVNEGMMAQYLIPSQEPEMIINYDEPAYSGQFSDDGNFFFACVKDFQVRMYDTSNPYNWKHYKTVHYPGQGHWTLSDASLSPDNMWLAYTSLCAQVALAPTDPKDTGDPYFLNLGSNPGAGRRPREFRIYSIRFSGDGRELVAGTSNGGMVVFDIESRIALHQVRGHEDDVNAVCFADSTSPHVLYSGSDDSTIKVWDRRSMAGERPAGAFVGHIEGITYVDSKGDGRYILSNGKDQTMKLWDLRMAMSSEDFDSKRPQRWANSSGFDYRWGHYHEDNWMPHPDDNSVVTFRGHKVLQTLIRCHFSPAGSTDSRYVYSGSHDGKVWIYNMDATVAGIMDVKGATKNTRPRHSGRNPRWETCVRDASWHPHAPMIVASALNGWDQDYGTCSVHSYNEAPDDDAKPKMGVRVDDKLNPSPYYHLDLEPGYNSRAFYP
ncbi:WD repeat domain-containing protein [Zalerion maritima]|uniref:WD repeat domain-containing protein n=1 Tax=Zalerion maritima TaxID=339359 RepID=A0AAD5WTX2_9PEZI|nr:WD repeat domain-containing protein [Zalerion maritima]